MTGSAEGRIDNDVDAVRVAEQRILRLDPFDVDLRAFELRSQDVR